jgi:adenosine deaminase
MYYDLHNHFYGSIPSEILYRIGKKNPSPRWSVFLDFYEKLHKTKIHPEDILSNHEQFTKYYLFKDHLPFDYFQSKFNLIIALVTLDKDELTNLPSEIFQLHKSQGVQFAEYRFMFPKTDSKEMFKDRLKMLAEGFAKGEEETKFKARIAMSLHRDQGFQESYQWIKEEININTLLKKYLVGIDFCNFEEGFPPEDKFDFFQKVIRDNLDDPHQSLAILYHVGESYQDKFPQTAVRWISELVDHKVHRLGHCLALGISPSFYKKTTRTEMAKERVKTLEWILREWIPNDYVYKSSIENQLKMTKSLPDGEILTREWDSYLESELMLAQEIVFRKLRASSTVVETCPSSNVRIGGLHKTEFHPVFRFIKENISWTLATDDPGILDTSLLEEETILKDWNLSEESLKMMHSKTNLYTSEILAGRESK